MNSNFFLRLLRLITLLLTQVLICNNIHLFGCISPMIICYMLVCMNRDTSRTGMLLWGFSIGLLHDMFANTAGIAAAACTLTAMMQPSILGMFLPRDAANDFAPTYRSLGFSSYMSYTMLICLVINTVYVALSTFSLYNWQTTVIAIVGSTALTTAIIMLVDAIVHTRETGR